MTELSREVHRAPESLLSAMADEQVHTQQPSLHAAVSAAAGTAGSKRSLGSADPTLLAPPTKRPATTSMKAVPFPPYTPQEKELLRTELLAALRRGESRLVVIAQWSLDSVRL